MRVGSESMRPLREGFLYSVRILFGKQRIYILYSESEGLYCATLRQGSRKVLLAAEFHKAGAAPSDRIGFGYGVLFFLR